MTWLTPARDVFARWGSPARFAVRQIVANAFPGGSAAVELVDKVLEHVQKCAKDNLEAEAAASDIASADELRRVGLILDEVNGRLGGLVDQIAYLEDMPEAADRLVTLALANDEAVREGFRRVEELVGRLDRIEAQGRAIMQGVGHGNELAEANLALMTRFLSSASYLDELRDEGIGPRELGGLFRQLVAIVAAFREGHAASVLPQIQALNAARPRSATIHVAMAVGASLTGDSRAAERALTTAARLRPDDPKLADLSRRVTRATAAVVTPTATAPMAPPPLAVGEVVDGWRLTRLIGQGGCGQVFEAEQAGHRRALKLIRPELANAPGFEETFKREILTLHALGGQPFLVKLDTFGMHRPSGCWYFLMELVEGESLQARLDRLGPLPPREAVALFRRVAGEGGLATAHARGVGHRDIKPANLILRADGSPVLVDFGLALAGSLGVVQPSRVGQPPARRRNPPRLGETGGRRNPAPVTADEPHPCYREMVGCAAVPAADPPYSGGMLAGAGGSNAPHPGE